MTTAEIYRLATIILVDLKVPNNVDSLIYWKIRKIISGLEQNVEFLLLFGSLSTALNPLFNVFYLCVMTRHFILIYRGSLYKVLENSCIFVSEIKTRLCAHL